MRLDYLELRRLRADVTLCYKIIRLVLLSPGGFFTFISNSITRGQLVIQLNCFYLIQRLTVA